MSVMRAAASLDATTFGVSLQAIAARAAGTQTGLTPSWHVRVRYVGQGHELDIPCTPGETGAAISERFSHMHDLRYGFTLDRPVEIVAARVAVTGAPVALKLSAPVDQTKTMRGPAVITLSDATMVVADGWTARPLAIGGWMVERQ